MTTRISDKRIFTVVLFSIYVVVFGSLRYFLEGDHWGFLLYNFWLAWIPLLIAGIVRWREWTGWKLALCGIPWLLFLPNAPYIVTDFIHMRYKSTLPWFDLTLIFNYAFAGLLTGALSIDWMKSSIKESLGHAATNVLLWIVFLLCGIGIMMGRDLRINSKDFFIEPVIVCTKTFQALDHTNITKSLVYAATFGMFYAVFCGLQSEERE